MMSGAYDAANRIVYVMDAREGSCTFTRLVKINLPCLAALGTGTVTTGTLACIAYEEVGAESPIPIRSANSDERVVWDSVNTKLYNIRQGGQADVADLYQFSAYSPAAGYPASWASDGTWEVLVDYQAGIEPATDPPDVCPAVLPSGTPNPDRSAAACSQESADYCCLLRGSIGGFDPVQNAVCIYGTARNAPQGKRFVYCMRYAEGVIGPTSTPTLTRTPSSTPTRTNTLGVGTPTFTRTHTATATPTFTPTHTPTPSWTPTNTAEPTEAPTYYPDKPRGLRFCQEAVAGCR